MNLLLTADLHFRIHWFRWLIGQAPNFDLVCVAGDLVDMFKSETRLEQAREVRTLVRMLADLVPVAVCSGNHDNAGRLASHDRASVFEWFIELGTHRNVITDGSTRKLENLIVTTIPYHSRGKKSQSGSIEVTQFANRLRCRGSFFTTFRPKRARAVSGEESEAAELFAAYRPDYFVSGHNHALPYTTGQCWNQKLRESRLLVPGRLLSAPFRTTSSWTVNQENSLGTLQAILGYWRMGYMIILC